MEISLLVFQIEEGEQAEFEQALAQLNYVFEDVTESKSYRYFLRLID